MTDSLFDDDTELDQTELGDTELGDAELDDVAPERLLVWSRPELSALRNPLALRAVSIIVIALAVLLWPERTDQILARLVGVGLIVVSLTSAWTARRRSFDRRRR